MSLESTTCPCTENTCQPENCPVSCDQKLTFSPTEVLKGIEEKIKSTIVNIANEFISEELLKIRFELLGIKYKLVIDTSTS